MFVTAPALNVYRAPPSGATVTAQIPRVREVIEAFSMLSETLDKCISVPTTGFTDKEVVTMMKMKSDGS